MPAKRVFAIASGLLALLFSVSAYGQQTSTPPSPKKARKVAVPRPATVSENGEQQRESSDNPRAREDWFYKQRTYPLKSIPWGIRQKAFERLEEMRRAERDGTRPRAQTEAELISEAISTTTWTSIGPQASDSGIFGLTSGRVVALAVDPTDPNIVYLGGAQGGVWKTTDGGTNWTPLTDFEASMAVGSIAIDPNSCSPAPCSTIYVGTGEQTFSGVSYYGAGILKSTNGGQTWTQLGQNIFVGPFGPGFFPGGGARIGSLAISPGLGPNPGQPVILAGVQINTGTNLPGNLTPGLFCSDDGGQTWNIIPAVSGAVGTEVVYASNSVAFAALGRIVSDAENGIYASTNANAACSAQTWVKIFGTPGTEAIAAQSSLGRIEIAVSPGATPPTSSTIYASIGNGQLGSSSLLGIFKTTNGGTSWTRLNAAPDHCSPQCSYDHVIKVHPDNPNVVYAGGSAEPVPGAFNSGRYFIRSIDGGTTWTGEGASGSRIHVDIHTLAFGKSGTTVKLYNGNDGGVWSTDASNPVGAVAWSNLNASLAITQHYPGLSSHPSDETLALIGSQDNDTHRYTGMLQWRQVGPGCDGGYTVIDAVIPSTWYLTCQAVLRLRRSTQNGAPGTFAEALNGIDQNDPSAFIPPMIGDPNTAQRLYFGTIWVYQSNNSGLSWQVISPELSPIGVVASIAVGQNTNSDIVYAASDDGRVWRTPNATSGINSAWVDITGTGLPPRELTQVAVHSMNPNIVFATFSGFSGFVDVRGHVFRAVVDPMNPAATVWIDISGTLPNTPANDLAPDPFDISMLTLYLATDVGVFVTTDGGVTWTTMVTGLPRVAVFSVKVSLAQKTLRVATHGRGVWELQLPGLPPFHLRTISPPTATAGAADLTVTAKGNGFGANSRLRFNTTDLLPSMFSVTDLTVVIPAAQLGTSGLAAVSVVDAGQMPTQTNPLTFTITASAPTLTNISPNTVAQGSATFNLVATGTNFSSNSQVFFNGVAQPTTFDSPTQLTAQVQAAAVAVGGVFPVSVITPPPGGGPSASLNFTVSAPVPTNDNFANAINISGVSFTDSQNNVSATVEAGDPLPNCVVGAPGLVNGGRERSIWYRFAAPANGAVALATFGSAYDTILTVVTGSPGAFTQVACNDDVISGTIVSSQLLFDATSGTTYFIMISSFNGNGGATTLDFVFLQAPANDNFANARVVNAVPFTDNVSSLGASTETADPTPTCAAGAAGNGRAKSIWYRYTPGTAGTATFDTFASNYDTILSVFTGAPGALVQVACNDDAVGLESQVSFAVVAGTQYHVMLTDFNGFGGDAVFHVTAGPQPGADFSLSVNPATVTVTRGQSGTSTITVTGVSGFASAVTLSCSGLPALSNCSFNPASPTPGAAPATSTLTITTTAGSLVPPVAVRWAPPPVFYWLAASALLLLPMFLQVRRMRRPVWVASGALLVIVALLVLQAACGGGGGSSAPPPNPGTPRGTFTVTITGTSGATARSTTLTLTVN